ncbi:MAG: hypothetical protein M1836_002567 [Candelina mexicana]|nr:MAG: hypothetical protein M1836_002567 [Candelina mexicana]
MKTAIFALFAVASLAAAAPANDLEARNWWNGQDEAKTKTVTATVTQTQTQTQTYCPPPPVVTSKPIDTQNKVCDFGNGNPAVTITKPHQIVTSTKEAGPQQTVYIFDIDQFIDQSVNTYVTVNVYVNEVVQQNFVQIWAPVTYNTIVNNINNNVINYNSIVNNVAITQNTDNSVTQLQDCHGAANTCLQANGPIIIDNSSHDSHDTYNNNINNNNNNNNNNTAPHTVIAYASQTPSTTTSTAVTSSPSGYSNGTANAKAKGNGKGSKEKRLEPVKLF